MSRKKRKSTRTASPPQARSEGRPADDATAAGAPAGEPSPGESGVGPPRPSLCRRSFLRLLVVLIGLGAYLAGVLGYACLYRPVGKLAGLDVLSLPGDRVELRAKIEQDGPAFVNPDVEGIVLRFSMAGAVDALPRPDGKAEPSGGEPLGKAPSDDDGFATITIEAPSEPGHYRVDIRLADPAAIDLREKETFLLLTVLPADGAIIITDIDNTICRTDLGETLADRPEAVPPLDGAPETLREAARKAQIVYVTARPLALTHRTRHWLATHDFPPGPVYLRDLSTEFRRLRLSESLYKSHLIQEKIRAHWKKIVWGIGNTAGDQRAYRSCLVPTILIAPADPGLAETDSKVFAVPDWKAAAELID